MRPSFSPWSFGRIERGLFAILLGLHLVPIWAFRYFATTDGPAHLYNAWVFKAMLLDPQSRFHTLFSLNPNPEPNYLSHLLLAGLLTVLPPWLAEKGVLTLYVVGLPLAVRYMVRSWQPAAGFLAVLAFPFVYSMVLQWGFYNFCLSMVVLLLAIGYWKRHLAAPRTATMPRVLGMLGLVTLLYLAHPLAYLAGGLLLGLLVIEQLVATPAGAPNCLQRMGASLGPLVLAFGPTLPMLAWYFWRKGGEGNSALTATTHFGRFSDWLLLEPLRYMGAAEGSYRTMVTVLLLGALLYTGWKHWRGQALAPGWAWLAGALILGVGYVIVPEALAGGSIIRPRLGLLSYLVLLGGLATVPYVPAVRWVLLLAGFAVAAVFLLFRFGRYQTLQTGLAEYRSAGAHIRRGSSLAPLVFSHATHMPNGKEYGSYIDAFGHAAGYLAVERNLVNLDNYEAQTGYFPLVWRPGQERLSQLDSLPSRLDIASRFRSALPDYVLIWGATDTAAFASTNAHRALAQLADSYEPVYRSPTGLVLLYEHRTTASAIGAP